MSLSEDLKVEPTTAPAKSQVFVGMFFFLTFFILVLMLPREVLVLGDNFFLYTIGTIAIWRYGWWGVHLVRGVIYSRVRFPKLRAAADAIAAIQTPPHVYVIVMAYRIKPKTTWVVYDSLFRDAIDYGGPVTIIVAIGEPADKEILKRKFAEAGAPPAVQLMVMFQDGTGKRSALAEALRAMSRTIPRKDSVAVFMDGDIRLPRGTLRRTIPFFQMMPDLGGLTTDNRPITVGSNWVREWYDLRMAQRHLLMKSMALSRGLLVMTGRYSVFRADIATRQDFIDNVEADHLVHWRLGRIQFLSGDDKSTWNWLLKHRWAMLYVPDVQVQAYEALPNPSLISGSFQLMTRWYGNMLRASGRAILLGRKHIGLFTWWSLVDQRVSMWTTLVGPIATVMLAIKYDRPSFFLIYAAWVMFTRLTASIIIGLQRRRFSSYYPILLYYSQMTSALIKTHITFRVDQPRWTRQGIGAVEGPQRRSSRRQWILSGAMHAVAMGYFVLAIGLFTHVLAVPDRMTVQLFVEFVSRIATEGSNRIGTAIGSTASAGVVKRPGDQYGSALPRGTYGDDVTSVGYGRGPAVPTTVSLDAAWRCSLDTANGTMTRSRTDGQQFSPPRRAVSRFGSRASHPLPSDGYQGIHPLSDDEVVDPAVAESGPRRDRVQATQSASGAFNLRRSAGATRLAGRGECADVSIDDGGQT